LKHNRLPILFLISLFCLSPLVFAAVPASQQMGAIERARELQQEQENLTNQVEKQKTNEKNQENAPVVGPEGPTAKRVLVKSIEVTGVTLFPDYQIRAITSLYENKSLTFNEMQKVADLITDLYRKNGYVISRAYIPPQKIENGVLEIKVLESTVGTIQLKGNRYYSSNLIKSYLTIKSGQPFNYNDLKKDLENINDHPDRSVKAVLAPGNQPGSTDIMLEEKDSLPVHVQLGYNNYLSSFLGRNIYDSTFTDNNLLGHDDILNFNYERGDNNVYYAYTTSYLYPVTHGLDLGASISHSKEVLGGAFAAVGSSGESDIYSFYGSQKLIKTYNITSHFNFGFDYKNVFNYLGGNVSSQDKLRIAKTGFDFQMDDDYGRTIITDGLNFGIPDIMGGTRANIDDSDVPTSRAGADGKFFMDDLNMMRLQKLPFDTSLLWRNNLQFSPSKLTSTEQFQVGGPDNNRGYSPAEYVGDQGYTMNWDLGVPFYFIPRYWDVPGSKSSVYNATRLIGFYDWSNVHLNSLQPGDSKNRTISSAGTGIKFDLPEGLSASYEIAWPLAAMPSDKKGVHQWIEVSVTF